MSYALFESVTAGIGFWMVTPMLSSTLATNMASLHIATIAATSASQLD